MLCLSDSNNGKRRNGVLGGIAMATLLSTLAQRGSADIGVSVLSPRSPISLQQVYCAPQASLSGTGLGTTFVDVAGQPASARQWMGWNLLGNGETVF